MPERESDITCTGTYQWVTLLSKIMYEGIVVPDFVISPSILVIIPLLHSRDLDGHLQAWPLKGV